MTEDRDRTPLLALGELRGLLAAFAWANCKCNHGCTFTVEELPCGSDLDESLTRHFGEWADKVSAKPLSDWRLAIGEALHKWLFQFDDVVNPKVWTALTDEGCQKEIISRTLDAFAAGLQPSEIWRVEVNPRGFYECAWDDFAIRGGSGLFLLHLGVSD